jgi:hypothetical protein
VLITGVAGASHVRSLPQINPPETAEHGKLLERVIEREKLPQLPERHICHRYAGSLSQKINKPMRPSSGVVDRTKVLIDIPPHGGAP